MLNQMQHVTKQPILTKVINRYVHRMTFPAVTICPDREEFKNDSLTSFEQDVFHNLMDKNVTFFKVLQDRLPETYKEINLVKILKAAYSPAMELVHQCSFRKLDCLQHVQTVWSKTKMCYTVNSVVEDGLPLVARNETEMLKSTVPGAEMGLELVLKRNVQFGVKVGGVQEVQFSV